MTDVKQSLQDFIADFVRRRATPEKPISHRVVYDVAREAGYSREEMTDFYPSLTRLERSGMQVVNWSTVSFGAPITNYGLSFSSP